MGHQYLTKKAMPQTNECLLRSTNQTVRTETRDVGMRFSTYYSEDHTIIFHGGRYYFAMGFQFKNQYKMCNTKEQLMVEA